MVRSYYLGAVNLIQYFVKIIIFLNVREVTITLLGFRKCICVVDCLFVWLDRGPTLPRCQQAILSPVNFTSQGALERSSSRKRPLWWGRSAPTFTQPGSTSAGTTYTTPKPRRHFRISLNVPCNQFLIG